MDGVMKYLLLCLHVIFLVACIPTGDSSESPPQAQDRSVDFSPRTQQEKWKADTALYLYQTIEKYNFDYAANNYVTDPKAVLALKDGWRLKADSYRVKEINEQGLVMGFSRFCYPEIDVQVYMVQRGQRYYVEFGRTLREQVRKHSNTKPLRSYCYDFKDQPLQGVVMSRSWSADRAEVALIEASSRKRLTVDAVTKECVRYPECKYLNEEAGSGIVLGLSSLDFNSQGGNLGGRQYVSFSHPDYTTINRHEGSYKVSKLENGKVRLQLAIPEFESTEINGYIDFELPES